jgi:four helix bundle protein
VTRYLEEYIMSSTAQARIRTYRDLVAWQLGMDLVEKVYKATRGFPEAERYGLISQMRRSSVSVPANIAEGYGRGRNKEFHRFLEVARGSLFELQTHAELARRLGWIKGESLKELRELMQRTDAVLAGLMSSVRRRET